MSGKLDGKKRKKADKKGKGNHLGTKSKGLLISEINLLLSEKRTSLATLRTGIGLLPIPLTVFMVLIATSSYFEPEKLLLALVAISIFCICLVAIGLYLIWNSMRHIHHIDSKIRTMRKKDEEVGDLIEDSGFAG